VQFTLSGNKGSKLSSTEFRNPNVNRVPKLFHIPEVH